MFCLEFSGLHYCLFVKVLFLLLEVFPEELSFLSLRQLIDFIISSSVCQELFFILFSSFFRNLIAHHSQQQFVILSELAVHVKQFFIFLNFFLGIRVAFVRRNSRKFYQDYSSMSSIFSSFLKKEVPSHSLRWNFSIALSFFSCQPVFAFFLLFYNPVTSG